MTTLTTRGYGIPKSMLTAEELTEIKTALMVKPFNAMNTGLGGDDRVDVKSFPVFLESHSKLYVPKVWGIKRFGLPSEVKLPEADAINIQFTGELRPIQKPPIDAFLAACADPSRMGGIISLACGAGKTVCGLYIISKLKTKTMIVAHKEFLLDQWKERIEQFLPGARVGVIKASKFDIDDKDIIVASVQSLSMKEYEKRALDSIGLIIVDECHRTGAEVFSRIYRKHNVKYTLGLSATVNRKDGLTKVFKWHIGDIVYKAKRVKDTLKVAMKEFYVPNQDYCREWVMYNKKPNMAKMINQICAFQPRNVFIAEALRDVLAEELYRKTIILSDRRQHLETLHDMLTEMGITSGFYYGGLKPEELKESEQKQVLLATFAYSSEGLDVRGLNTMILSTPKSDIIQSVGRILRDKPEERAYTPLVIDIMDKFSIFPSQARKRMAYYKTQGYDVDHDKLFDASSIDFSGKCYIQDLG